MAQATVKTHKRKGRVVKQHKRKVDGTGKVLGPLAGKEFDNIGEKMAYLRGLKGGKKPDAPKAKSSPVKAKTNAPVKAPVVKKPTKGINKPPVKMNAGNRPAKGSVPAE